jgi:hypothetical protein
MSLHRLILPKIKIGDRCIIQLIYQKINNLTFVIHWPTYN